MGREIRRVPLDFDWPLGEVWKGYVNPHYRECPKALLGECHNGFTNDGCWLNAIARFIALVGEQAIEASYADKLQGRIFPHPYLEEFGPAPRTQLPREERLRIRELPESERLHEMQRATQKYPSKVLIPGDGMVELVTGLAGKLPDPPYGGNLEWYVTRTLKRAAGIDADGNWGICSVCGGHGVDPDVRELWEGWQREGPPRGDGWQLWETVTEGSPISPVFSTAEGLIDWMSQPDVERGYPDLPWDQGYKRAHAEALVRGPGWAPTIVVLDGSVMGGAEAIATMARAT